MQTTTKSTTIDCGQCMMKATEACQDCVVTFLCDREPGEAVIIDVEEARALRVLGKAGLVPRLRHQLVTPQSQAG